MPRIFMVAGEPSGDAHGAELCRAILERAPGVEIEGLGGPKMAEAGCKMRANLVEHAVMGVLRVLPRIPFFFRLLRETARYVIEGRFDILVPIDYPGFNIRLSRRVKDGGVRVCYYVSPQNWAWRSTPVRKVVAATNRILCLFPFETRPYEEAGLAADYVGHPLWDAIERSRLDEEWLGTLNAGGNRLVAILPGSRRQEIQRNLPVFLRAALRMSRESTDPLSFALASPSPAEVPLIEALLRRHGENLPVAVGPGKFRELASRADLALVTSGTATLELLYRAVPMIVGYRTSIFGSLLAWLILRVPHIALPNILAGREIVPEHVTWRDRSERMAEQGLTLLGAGGDPVRRDLLALKDEVCQRGASDRAACALLNMLDRE